VRPISSRWPFSGAAQIAMPRTRHADRLTFRKKMHPDRGGGQSRRFAALRVAAMGRPGITDRGALSAPANSIACQSRFAYCLHFPASARCSKVAA